MSQGTTTNEMSEPSYVIKLINDLIGDEKFGENLFENFHGINDVFPTIESIVNPLDEFTNKQLDNGKSITSKNYEMVNDEKDDSINYIKKLMMYIDNNKIDNWPPNIIIYEFNYILSLSNEKSVAYYLVEHEILYKMLIAVNSKPNYVEIVLRIIIECSKHESVITSIGTNPKFVESILSHLISNNDLILLNILTFLKLVVRRIQSDYKSNWLVHLKSCKFFVNCIIATFKSQRNEGLIIAATILLKQIANTDLPNQSTLLKELFIINNLISVLFECCIRMILMKEKNNSPVDSEFIFNWLAIMSIIRKHIVTAFNRRWKSILLRILYIMLHPYQKRDNVFPKRGFGAIKQDLGLIVIFGSLLLFFHHEMGNPLIMDYMLMKIMLNFKTGILILNLKAAKIILNLKTVLDIESKEIKAALSHKILQYLDEVWQNDKALKLLLCTKETDSDTVIQYLHFVSEKLDNIWQTITQRRGALAIVSLLMPFDQKERQYFLNLVESNPLTQNLVKTINDNLTVHANNIRQINNTWKEKEEDFMHTDKLKNALSELVSLSNTASSLC